MPAAPRAAQNAAFEVPEATQIAVRPPGRDPLKRPVIQ